MAKHPKEGPAISRKSGQFEKGKSGNPAGRPKGSFGSLIREMTEDGGTLVAMRLRIASGKAIEVEDEDGRTKRLTPCIKDIQEAGNWLADRGWGKAPETVVNIDASGSAEAKDVLDGLTSEELRGLLKPK